VNFHNKLFRRYSVLLLVLLFIGCASSSFLYPWQQIEYSYDNQVKIFKTEMNKDDAISILKTHIRDDPKKRIINEFKTPGYKYVLYINMPGSPEKIVENETNKSNIIAHTSYISGTSNKDIIPVLFAETRLREMCEQRICFHRRKNIVIDKERIAFDDSIECWAFLHGSENINIYKYDGDDSIVSTQLEYSDVKKIKLFECTELIGVFYKIYLYNEANKLIFYFTLFRGGNQMENTQRLIAALSILIPHAKEEYNDRRFMVDPIYGQY
jgi:hypothetical protein